MSFPRYERYKDSNYGNGELPINWSEVRLKTILAQKITDGPHETPDFTEFGIPFLSVDGIQNGELEFAGCRHISEEAHWLYRKKVQPRRDDILLAKAASTGKIARVKTDIEFNIWSPLAVIRLDTSRSIPAFVEYVLQSPESQAQVEMLCTANTQKNISMDDIPLIAFALPPREIQSAIVTFLQRETEKIDALIEEQRRLIELLKEKRYRFLRLLLPPV
jgi:type I restriction enzyme S subunit